MSMDAEALIREHAAEARGLMIVKLAERWDALVEMAIERATTIGVDEYGDASFHKDISELWWELDCEFADAIFYTSLLIRKMRE